MNRKKVLSIVLAIILLSGCANSGMVSESVSVNMIDVGELSANAESAETISEESPETAAPTEEPSVEAESAEAGRTALHEPNREEFTARLHKVYADYDITGMSVALFCNGEIIHTENIGYADTDTKALCSDNTRYRTASVSKLVSTMVLMTLCDEGKIDPYSPLTEVTGIQYDGKNAEEIKLWHLLTHTSGIFDSLAYNEAVHEKYDVDYILSVSHSANEPGAGYWYTNFGAGTMGAIVERLTGEFFHDYADRVLFEPLGMDAGYVIDLIDDKQSCATLYDHEGGEYHVSTWGRTGYYYESFGLGNSYMTAQCELIITASDLARLGIALAGDGTVDGKTVLSESSVEAMHKPYFSTPDFDMGLNVRIYDDLIEGRTMYGHPGNALGVITGLYYDRTDGTGVVFLSNHCKMATDENGVYKAIKDTLEAAYECYLR